MCNRNKRREDDEDDETDSDSDSSDVSMSDSDDSGANIESEGDNEEGDKPDEAVEDEEEEDEVIKAIRSAADAKRDHPPAIHCEDFITDISFHPSEDLLAVANIVGDIVLYKYTNEENTIVRTFEVHTKSCRDIEFSGDGEALFSVAKDKTIMLSDV
jgi:WD40 repeat protein